MDPRLARVLRGVKRLAKEYYALTGRPLGATAEVAEQEAARILHLELCEARNAGYDAVRRSGARIVRIQIKGRCVLPGAGRGQRVGGIDLDGVWDVVALVLLDGKLEVTHIYEARRPAITAALRVPGSKARNERGQLSVSKFKSIGRLVWPRDASSR